MDVNEFYAEKKKAHNRLVKELLAGKYPGQPDPEDYFNEETDETEKRSTAVYMTSVRKREAGTVAGHVCLVEVYDQKGNAGLAAERIADGTHRVSTEDEIRAYLKRQYEQKVLHDKLDARREVKKTQQVDANYLNEMPVHLRQFEGKVEETTPQSRAGKR